MIKHIAFTHLKLQSYSETLYCDTYHSVADSKLFSKESTFAFPEVKKSMYSWNYQQ